MDEQIKMLKAVLEMNTRTQGLEPTYVEYIKRAITSLSKKRNRKELEEL